MMDRMYRGFLNPSPTLQKKVMHGMIRCIKCTITITEIGSTKFVLDWLFMTANTAVGPAIYDGKHSSWTVLNRIFMTANTAVGPC